MVTPRIIEGAFIRDQGCTPTRRQGRRGNPPDHRGGKTASAKSSGSASIRRLLPGASLRSLPALVIHGLRVEKTPRLFRVG